MKKMKKSLQILIIVVVNVVSTKAQDTYHIVHISGKITNLTTNKDLKIGDKISGENKLKFSTKSSKLIGLNPQKGRVVFTPVAASKENELVFYAKNVLTPAQEIKRLSTKRITRPDNDTTKVPLMNYEAVFSPEISYYIIGSQENVYLTDPRLPLNDPTLKLYYSYKNAQNVVTYRPIQILKEKIILNEHILYPAIAGKKVDQTNLDEVKLMRFNLKVKKYEEITAMKPLVFLDEKHLLTELKEYKKEALAATSQNQLFDELYGYFGVTYGSSNKQDFKAFLNKHKVL
jgi:hypothetical protein